MKSGFNITRENSDELEMIRIQLELLKNLDSENHVCKEKLKIIAGVDLAYWKQNDVEMATCCIVLVDYNSYEIIEKAEYTDKVECPYIPGCLAFRELPLFFLANEKLRNKPDLYVFDGNGYLHPRKIGIATHAGILLNIPTIGVAKSYYKIDDTDFIMPDNEPFAYTDIVIRGDVYGRVLRTHKNVKPIFISCGNMIDLATATEVIKNLIVKESHIPLPTWKADIETHKIRKCKIEMIEMIDG